MPRIYLEVEELRYKSLGNQTLFILEKVKINTEYIKLDQFLKWVNVVGQGSDAKELIMDGFVKVNGEVEFRRGKKLVIGDIVEVEKAKFEII
jgi:ribosome-associated protein